MLSLRHCRRAALVAASALLLGGCGALNLSSYIADNLPHWAGGLPPEAPPRVSDPRYAEFYKSQFAARDAMVAKAAATDAQDARIATGEHEFDRLNRTQVLQSARQQIAPRAVATATARDSAETDAFTLNGRALY